MDTGNDMGHLNERNWHQYMLTEYGFGSFETKTLMGQ